MFKLRRATSPDRVQLTTDGLRAYVEAVGEMLSDRVDFAQLAKLYPTPQERERRYSSPESLLHGSRLGTCRIVT